MVKVAGAISPSALSLATDDWQVVAGRCPLPQPGGAPISMVTTTLPRGRATMKAGGCWLRRQLLRAQCTLAP